MAMSGALLSSLIQQSLTETVTSTEYDPITGSPTLRTSILQPPIEKTDAIASNIIDHIQQFAVVDTSVNTQVVTTVQAQVLPGISVIAGSPPGPGSTTSTGTAQGSGQGSGIGQGIGRVS